jgi:ATP adenylyltransferase
MNRLWAPWRSSYVTGLADQDKDGGCFFCAARDASEPRPHLLLGRGKGVIIMMNRYPYNPGHLMVAPDMHAGEMEAIPAEVGAELWRVSTLCKRILHDALNAKGCNIGINQGRIAGAGVTDHLHVHVVPRWGGDANFMAVAGDTRVMSQGLLDLYDQLLPAFEANDLR